MSDAPVTQVRIERLGHRGDGVADGVFVPRALPDEHVEGVIDDGRMEQPRILEPSPYRVAAPCTHYRHCGGCALMHASDAFVAEWKQDVVRRALAAQGIEATVAHLHVSPPRARRRATLSGRRLKRGPVVGFHARASDMVTDIPECHLLHPDLIAVLPALEAVTEAGVSRKGEIALTITQSSAGVDVAVAHGKPLDAALRATLARILGAHGLARLAWDGEVVAQADAPFQNFGPARVVPPPGAFLQATAQGEAALLEAVRGALAGCGRIVDLFSGCGTFALPLAAQATVHAVEADSAMLEALAAGWRQALGLKLVTTERRDLFRDPLVAGELERFEAAVIDPPRAGAEAQIEQLALAGTPVIAMVSCNPVTFARDARRLVEAGYGMDRLTVVDQFRWSSHVELAARFRAGHTASGSNPTRPQ